MDQSLRFPSEADKIYRRALAYRRLSSNDRFLAIVDLIASGMALLEHSPHRAAGQQLRQAREAEWRRIHRELFQSHGQ
jgi:hypothetical protein